MTVNGADKKQRLESLELTSRWMKAEQGRVVEQVKEARQAGASWTEIGKALGVARQTAWAVYHNEMDEPDEDDGGEG